MKKLLICLCLMGCGIEDPLHPSSLPTGSFEPVCNHVEYKLNGQSGFSGVLTMDDDMLPDMIGLQINLSAKFLSYPEMVRFYTDRGGAFYSSFPINNWFNTMIDIGDYKGMLLIHIIGKSPEVGCPYVYSYVEVK